jgi:hypothetical protein
MKPDGENGSPMMLTGVVDLLKKFASKEDGGGKAEVTGILQKWIAMNKENVKVGRVGVPV